MVASPDVPVIGGSMRTGQAISAVGARQLKRHDLELGGKTLHLLFDDADLDAALQVLLHFDCHVQLQARIPVQNLNSISSENELEGQFSSSGYEQGEPLPVQKMNREKYLKNSMKSA